MTPEEKAKELIDKFFAIRQQAKWEIGESLFYDAAKQCALICVDEIIGTTYMIVGKYWRQVKIEIEKL